MLVGLMSDTHDRIPAIAELLKRMTERGVGWCCTRAISARRSP